MNYIAALLILLAGMFFGGVANHYYEQPSDFQKMLSLHDYMRTRLIREMWQEDYCSPEKEAKLRKLESVECVK